MRAIDEIEFMQWMKDEHPGHWVLATPDIFIPSLKLFLQAEPSKWGDYLNANGYRVRQISGIDDAKNCVKIALSML